MAENNSSAVDNILEAVDIIVGARISQLEFDKTLLCKIEDAKNAERGEYIVTDGATSFKAYSADKSYTEGISVYVSIPNGDMTKQKIITGKYVAEDSDKYYTYVDPMDTYVDITKNLVSMEGEHSLVANGPEKEILLWKSEIANGKSYDRLGLSAEFRSWLGSFKVASGTYGLKLVVISRETQTTSTAEVEKKYEYYFSSNEMYGDVYNFETFYKQNKVIDISGLSQIVRMSLYFYQDANFIDANGDPIPVVDEYNNLFVTNCFISLGYDTNDFDTDTLLLYTLDGETYTDDNTKDYYDKRNKLLQLRWIHFADDETLSVIDEESEIPEESIIHWYKYHLYEGISDALAGAFWEEILEDDGSPYNHLSLNISPEHGVDFERYKVIVESPSRDYIYTLKYPYDEHLEYIHAEEPRPEDLEDDLKELYDAMVAAKEKADSATATQEEKDLAIEAEDAYMTAIDKYDAQVKYFYSPILQINNEKPVGNLATIALVKGLQILCDEDNYQGIYRLYDMANKIQSTVESNKMRKLEATYTTLITGESELDTAERITWKIPLVNTMIHAPEEGKEYTLYEEDGVTPLTGIEFAVEDGYALITRTNEFDLTNVQAGDTYENKLEQYFRINEYYVQTYTNNTVYCIVTKNNITYTAEFTMTFGPIGTNGTDYTLTVEMDAKTTALTKGATTPTKINVKLFDYENKEIENCGGAMITYKWYSYDNDHPDGIVFCDANGNRIANNTDSNNLVTTDTSIYIKQNSAIVPYHWILEVNLNQKVNFSQKNHIFIDGTDGEENEKNDTQEDVYKRVKLSAFLPIAYRSNSQYREIAGTTKIVYDSNGGNPYYFKEAYALFSNKEQTSTDNVIWGIVLGDTSNGAAKYYPTITNDGVLTPPAMYYSENDKRVSVIAYVGGYFAGKEPDWVQPILIIQNRYASAMLNSWDGSLTIDQENGTILSTMVGAGKKDSENRFNGVLMGDVSAAGDDNASGIGIYGFHEGAQSFNFNVDGTAFIGKSGKGRILFDGNEGSITSQNYKKNDEGMNLDLNTGIITIKGPHKTQDNGSQTQSLIKLDPGEGTGNHTYFQIRTENDKQIMHVGTEGYYLQSEDYNSGKSGTKLDIANGTFTSYGKTANDKTGYVKLTGSGSTFFQINNGDKDLMVCGNGTYKLESNNYVEKSTGIKIDLQNGNIDARAGYIGGWSISNGNLSASKMTFYGSTGNINANNVFTVDGTTGKMTCTNVAISGSTSTINGVQISKAAISEGTIDKAAITHGTIQSATISECDITSGMTLSGDAVSKQDITFLSDISFEAIHGYSTVVYKVEGQTEPVRNAELFQKDVDVVHDLTVYTKWVRFMRGLKWTKTFQTITTLSASGEPSTKEDTSALAGSPDKYGNYTIPEPATDDQNG